MRKGLEKFLSDLMKHIIFNTKPYYKASNSISISVANRFIQTKLV